MDWHGWYVLGVIGLVLMGLVRNVATPDFLLILGSLAVALAGIITPAELLSGFSNEGMLTVAALFVVAAALRETGALDNIGHRLFGSVKAEKSMLGRMAVSVAGLSAFLNNTFVVAVLLPVIADWCRKNRISPSRLLIPLSYITVLGGTCTLIGTSTNLVVNGLMAGAARSATNPTLQQGLKPIFIFELAWVGVPITLAGVIYLLLIGRKLLPDRKDLLELLDESSREYLVDMQIRPDCRLIDQTIEQAGLRHLPGLFLIEIVRDHRVIAPVEPDEILHQGDHLTFTGVVSTIVDLERIPGLVPAVDENYRAESFRRRKKRLCEAVISRTSPLIGKNIRDADFRALYNAAIIAIHRGGIRLAGRIGDIVLRAGDTLLLQAGPHFGRANRNNPDFYLISSLDEARPVRYDRATLSLALLVLLVGLMVSGVAPVVVAALLVACLAIATRCISAADARQSIDWETLLTIAAAFGLGRALEKSGAAAYLAEGMVQLAGHLGPVAILAAVYLVTMLLTEMISNNAAAVLMFPLALSVADQMSFNPRPLVMAVMFAASLGFATPFGYQTNMMVYGPGGYRFRDFLKVGIPLNLICWILAVGLIPIVWRF